MKWLWVGMNCKCNQLFTGSSSPHCWHLFIKSVTRFLSMVGAAKSILFVVTKVLSWQNMSLVVTKVCLLWQNFYCDKIMFVATKYFCCDKSFVMTKHVFGRDKSMLAVTKLLLWQNYVCCDKIFLLWQKFCRDKYLSQQTRVCCDKSFVMTSTLLSQQKMCFVATKVNLLLLCLSWLGVLLRQAYLKQCSRGKSNWLGLGNVKVGCVRKKLVLSLGFHLWWCKHCEHYNRDAT